MVVEENGGKEKGQEGPGEGMFRYSLASGRMGRCGEW